MRYHGLILSVALLVSLATDGQSQRDNKPWLLVTDSAAGTYGYKSATGKMVIPLGKYSYCFTDTFRNYAIVMDSAKGLVGINGQERILYSVFIFDNGPDYPADGLFRITKAGKMGYADSITGKIAIEPKFACAWPFENGRAKVALDCQTRSYGEHSTWTSAHWFYINKKGLEVDSNKITKPR